MYIRSICKCNFFFSFLYNDACYYRMFISGKVAENLKRQVSSPVKWVQSIQKLQSLGVEKFIEVGPGKVLTGLLRQIDRDASGSSIEDAASLRSTLETL